MTQRTPPLDEADLDLLSAYIDDQLSATERSALEVRLGRETELRQALDELRSTVYVLRTLPQVTPPRSFTLDPSMAPARPWYAWLTPGLLRFGSTLAAVLLVISFIPDILAGMVGGLGMGGAAPASAQPTQAAAYGGSAGIAAMPTANMELQRNLAPEAAQPTAAIDLLSATVAPAATSEAAAILPPASVGAEATPASMPAATLTSSAQPPLADNPPNAAGGAPPSSLEPKSGSDQTGGTQDSTVGNAPIATSGSSSPDTARLDLPLEAPPQGFSEPQPAEPVSPWTILRIILAIAVVGLGLASWQLRREA